MIAILAQEGAQIASSFLIFGLIALVSLGVFLLVRSIMLWYWKVDTIVENQHKQLKELQRLVDSIDQWIEKSRQTAFNK